MGRISIERNPRGTAVGRTNHYPHPSLTASTYSTTLSNYATLGRLNSVANCRVSAGTGGAGTGAAVTGGGMNGNGNSYRVTWTTSATAASGGIEASNIDVTQPGRYTASVYVRTNRAQVMQLSVPGATNVTAPAINVPANTWTRLTSTVDVTTAAPLLFRAYAAGAGSTAWLAGNWVETCMYMMTDGDALLPWFDGYTAASLSYTYSFAGAAGTSRSIRTGAGLKDVPQGTAGGTLTQAATLVERVYSDVGQIVHGTTSAQVTFLRPSQVANIDFAGMSVGAFELEADKDYFAWLQVYTESAVGAQPQMQVLGDGVQISAPGAWPTGAPLATVNGFGIIGVPFHTSSVAGGSVLLRVIFTGTPQPGSRVWLDAVMVNDGGARQSYFDGSTADTATEDYQWVGDVDDSVSHAMIDDPWTLLAPILVMGWDSSRISGNRIHRVIGSSPPAATLRAAGLRSGTLKLFFDDRNAAFAAERSHGGIGVHTYTDMDTPNADMQYVVAEQGRINLVQDPEYPDRWVLNVDFEQIA